MRTHEIAYLCVGMRLIARFRVEFRLFTYMRFGEKYSKTREILRSKALLAPAAFLPEGTNRFCHASAGSETAVLAVFRVQIDAVLRDFARTRAKI